MSTERNPLTEEYLEYVHSFSTNHVEDLGFGEQHSPLTVGELVLKLQECEQDKPVVVFLKVLEKDEEFNVTGSHYELVSSDFKAYSYRGMYDKPAVDFTQGAGGTTVADAIENLKEVNGKQVRGYKGGNYTLSEDDILYFANYAETNDDTAAFFVFEMVDCVAIYTMTNCE